MEINKLMKLKVKIFEYYGLDISTKSRTMDNNFLRHAYCNCLRPYYSTNELGGALGRNHSTIIHYKLNHDGLLIYPFYTEAYDRILGWFLEMANDEPINFELLKRKMQSLHEQIDAMQKMIDRYEQELQSDMV
jgi:tRNA A-37 threonylcarbamoyl transferase component Bud32